MQQSLDQYAHLRQTGPLVQYVLPGATEEHLSHAELEQTFGKGHVSKMFRHSYGRPHPVLTASRLLGVAPPNALRRYWVARPPEEILRNGNAVAWWGATHFTREVRNGYLPATDVELFHFYKLVHFVAGLAAYGTLRNSDGKCDKGHRVATLYSNMGKPAIGPSLFVGGCAPVSRPYALFVENLVPWEQFRKAA